MSIIVSTVDGKHAIDIDPTSRFYGWVFWRHPDGQWVTKRKATSEELLDAKLVDAGKKIDADIADLDRDDAERDAKATGQRGAKR